MAGGSARETIPGGAAVTSETYNALAECARRRLEHEWDCTDAEHALLSFITELSFDLGQTWAHVPCLADFAAVLGLHKSTICRALRSARKKGFLLILMRRDETLYSICTETRGSTAEESGADLARLTRARLVEMNKNRLQGKADADGQQRIPGILPSEEVEAPARAFEALLEATNEVEGATKSVPCETKTPPASQAQSGDEDDETDAEFQARLERMTRTMEQQRGDPVIPPAPPGSDRQRLDEEMSRLCRGLKGEQLHAMERLREEFSSAGKLQEAVFFKWGRAWLKRVRSNARLVLEACGDHKNLRMTGKGADEPGAWIFTAMKDLNVNTC